MSELDFRSLSSLGQTLGGLTTEQRDPALSEIDTLSIEERCLLQNRIDQTVGSAVGRECAHIAKAVRSIVDAIHSGGRLVYVGAGTSGRLGVLDASECPPTFGTPREMVQAIIAGGETALIRSVEGGEDDPVAGSLAIDSFKATAKDCIVGITASGRTPYVLGALARAREIGAATVGVTNNRPSEIEHFVDVAIAVVTGPEFVAGSTRLKAGTAQKLVLNMLTTQTMIELGKTYGDAMVDVMATNTKLKARAHRLVREITGGEDEQVAKALDSAGGSAKLAILMLMKGADTATGRRLLEQADGKLRVALEA